LSAAEFCSEAVDWVSRHVDIDAANLVKLEGKTATIRHTRNLDPAWIQRFHRSIANYGPDFESLITTSLAMGGCFFGEWSRLEKWAALPDRKGFEEDMAFSIGLRTGTTVVLTMRGIPTNVLFLARAGRRSRIYTPEDAQVLANAAPVLTLGMALHEPPATVVATDTAPRLRRGVRASLTARERSVIEYVVLGLTNRQIALALGSSPLTVRNQLGSIFKKLSVGSRTELASVALSEGLVEPRAATGTPD
jgi:DNA-binding NarL/FixJ family response regulator